MSQETESGNLLAGIDVVNDVELLRDDPARDHGADPQQSPQQPRKTVVRRKPVSSGSNIEAPSQKTNASFELLPLNDNALPTETEGDIWSPGLWRQFPVPSALALFGCSSFIVASIIVLVKSDDQPTSDWTLSPTVYLALLTTGTNMLARFAFGEGVKIMWWHTALQGGTIQDLHNRSAYADGFVSALTSGRQFNLVALASLAVTIMVIDQPLIQRASSIASVSRTVAVNVTASIAPEIPWGFTSYMTSSSVYDQVMTQPMILAFNDYNSQAPIDASRFSGCKGTCTGYVEAGGLSAQCTTATGPIWYNLVDSFLNSASPFSVNFLLIPQPDTPTPPPVYIQMNVAFTSNSNADSCVGVYTQRKCNLVSATMRYPIDITENTITIGDILGSGTAESFQPDSSGFGFNTDRADFSFWTLGGFYLAAFALFNSSAMYIFDGSGTILQLPDTLSTQFIDLSGPNNYISAPLDGLAIPVACGTNWTDPTSHILTALNAMAFRLSLAAASVPYRNTAKPPPPQILTMQQTSDINVFRSDYRFLIASTILTTAMIVLIMPIFIGWWDLGRRVTLNPIEIAKAFDAPLLRGPGTNEELSGLMTRYGANRLRLGEMEEVASGSVMRKWLKLADPIEVGKPRAGVVYA